MCGIAALFAPRPQPLSELVVAMTALARHRGPDDEGYAEFSGTTAKSGEVGRKRLKLAAIFGAVFAKSHSHRLGPNKKTGPPRERSGPAHLLLA